MRERIAQLRKLGLTYQAITDRTGISYFTIQNWSTQIGKRTSGFHQLAVVAVESKPSTVTVPAVTGTQEKEVAHLNTVDQIRPGTVTATTPDGYKLQLNDLSAVVQIIGELRKQKR